MAERCIKGDYIGFTFGDVHSSELGLMRVSNGSRYEQDLLPPLQDKTAQVNGRDGAVYFDSQYNTRSIKVPVAFDNMTEESFQKLKQLVMDKKPKYLWFDETPYKQWLVKAGGLQTFKWICFDESKNIERIDDGDSKSTKKRIYKGDGTLEFSCFTPYAESRVTFLDDQVDYVWDWNREKSPKRLVQYFKEDADIKKYLNGKNGESGEELQNLTLEYNYNFEEWADTSRLKYQSGYNKYENQQMDVYNAGDIPTNLQIKYSSQLKDELTLTLSSSFKEGKEIGHITLKPFSLIEGDDGFIIDSKIKLIKGTKKGNLTGNIYNKYIKNGDFFKIPVCDTTEFYRIKSSIDQKFSVEYKHYYI